MRLDEIVDIVQIDTWGFQYQVVVIQIAVIIFAYDKFQVFVVFVFVNFQILASVGSHNIHVGEVFPKEAVRGDAFPAKAENDDFFVSYLI